MRCGDVGCTGILGELSIVCVCVFVNRVGPMVGGCESFVFMSECNTLHNGPNQHLFQSTFMCYNPIYTVGDTKRVRTHIGAHVHTKCRDFIEKSKMNLNSKHQTQPKPSNEPKTTTTSEKKTNRKQQEARQVRKKRQRAVLRRDMSVAQRPKGHQTIK